MKPDNEKAVYLTTSQNIISLVRDGAKKNISVSLVNGEDAGQNGFTWEVINSAESSPSVISLMANGTNAEISKIHREIDEEKQRNAEEFRINKEQKELEKKGFVYKNSGQKKELPSEIQKMFDDIKNDMLTNSN